MSRDTVRDGFARHPLEACAELFDRAPNLAAVVAAVAEDEPATWKGPQREGGKGDGIDVVSRRGRDGLSVVNAVPQPCDEVHPGIYRGGLQQIAENRERDRAW